MNDHHGGLWDRFSVYLTIGSSHLKELESIILRIVKPTGNKIKGKFRKASNLNRRFATDIRKMQRNELIELFGEAERPQTMDKTKEIKGYIPILSKYTRKRLKLNVVYKGRLIKAHVLKDGKISVNGKTFTSPSMAGQYVVKRPTCNGWKFWKYERAPGDWVILDKLRG